MTAKKAKLITALLSMDITTACQAAGVARSAYYRWIEEEEFKSQLSRARAELFEAGKRVILGSFEEAAAKLLDRMRKSKRDDVIVKAAQLLLDFNLRVKQLEEIETRLR